MIHDRPRPSSPQASPRTWIIAAERIDLAAAFRWFARLDMHESVANHLSLAVSEDGREFLINPRGRHFSRISRLRSVAARARRLAATLERPDAPDPTAWYLHARLHAQLSRRPAASCICTPSTPPPSRACKDRTMYPIDMNTMRFFGRVALDAGFSGMALSDAEGDRVAELDGGRRDGTLDGESRRHGRRARRVAQTFDEFYYFERAAQTLLTCYATGKELAVVPDEVAALTERQWRGYGQLAIDHFENHQGHPGRGGSLVSALRPARRRRLELAPHAARRSSVRSLALSLLRLGRRSALARVAA